MSRVKQVRMTRFEAMFLEALGFRKRTKDQRQAKLFEFTWSILDQVYLLKHDDGFCVMFNLEKGPRFERAYTLKQLSILLALVPRVEMLNETLTFISIERNGL